MSTSRFYINIAMVSVAAIFLMYFLGKFFSFEVYLDLGLITWVLFFLMGVLLYYIANVTVNSPNRTKFISLTIANMFIKMVLSVGIVLIYFKLKNPESPVFIVPFIIIYVFFTIFETYFLLKIANLKKYNGRI